MWFSDCYSIKRTEGQCGEALQAGDKKLGWLNRKSERVQRWPLQSGNPEIRKCDWSESCIHSVKLATEAALPLKSLYFFHSQLIFNFELRFDSCEILSKNESDEWYKNHLCTIPDWRGIVVKKKTTCNVAAGDGGAVIVELFFLLNPRGSSPR